MFYSNYVEFVNERKNRTLMENSYLNIDILPNNVYSGCTHDMRKGCVTNSFDFQKHTIFRPYNNVTFTVCSRTSKYYQNIFEVASHVSDICVLRLASYEITNHSSVCTEYLPFTRGKGTVTGLNRP